MVKSGILFVVLVILSRAIVLNSPLSSQMSGNGIYPLTFLLLFLLFISSVIFVVTFAATISVLIKKLKPAYKNIIFLSTLLIGILLIISGIDVFNSIKSGYPRPYIQYILPIPLKIWNFWTAFILLCTALSCVYNRVTGKVILLLSLLVPLAIALVIALRLHGNPLSTRIAKKTVENLLKEKYPSVQFTINNFAYTGSIYNSSNSYYQCDAIDSSGINFFLQYTTDGGIKDRYIEQKLSKEIMESLKPAIDMMDELENESGEKFYAAVLSQQNKTFNPLQGMDVEILLNGKKIEVNKFISLVIRVKDLIKEKYNINSIQFHYSSSNRSSSYSIKLDKQDISYSSPDDLLKHVK